MTKKRLDRILIKLSGESLMGKENYGIELNTVNRIAKDLISLKKCFFQRIPHNRDVEFIYTNFRGFCRQKKLRFLRQIKKNELPGLDSCQTA